MVLKYLTVLLAATGLLGDDIFYYSDSKKIYLQTVKASELKSRNLSSVYRNVTYYKTPQNNIVGVNQSLIVKFSDLDKFDILVQKYKLIPIKKLYSSVYLFELEKNNSIFNVCNEIYQLPYVDFAHPNFIQEVNKR